MASSYYYVPLMHTDDLALFSEPPMNVAEDKVMWVEHLPTFGKNGKASVQFEIPGTGNQYTDLSRTYLYVKLSIVDKKGDAITHTKGRDAAGGLVTTQFAIPINNVLHSLWSMVDIKCNKTLVSTSGDNYMYKAYVENLLNYNSNATEKQMQMVGFAPEGGNMDSNNPDDIPVSIGLNNRAKWWEKVETNDNEQWKEPTCVEFVGPLMADICNQDRLILNGVDIDIKLWPNKDIFRLMAFPDDDIDARVLIEDIKLNVCKVNVNSATVLGIENQLQSTPAMYPFSRTEVRTKNIPKGSFGDVFEDMFQGEVPNRLLIGFVDAEAYSGSYTLNPFRFKPYDIASLGFYVDGEPTPRPPYEFDFGDCDYIEGLQSLYQISGKLNENTDLCIDRETYRQGHCLIGFEVDPTSSPNLSYVGQPKAGRTRITIRFHKALPDTVTTIVFATFAECMLIDSARIVSLREKEKSIARITATSNK